MSETKLPELPESKPKPQGIPMWTALVVLAVLAVLVAAGIGGLWYYFHSDKLKLERQREALQNATTTEDLAKTKIAQNAGLALAATHQQTSLGQIRSATNLLMRLMVDSARLRTDAVTLKTSEAGRAVALFPDLVVQATHFYETDLGAAPSREDIITKIEGARRIEQQLIGANGTGYEPPSDMSDTIQSISSWADSASRKTDELRKVLAAFVEESKIKYTESTVTRSSPTLETAMAKTSQSEAAANQLVAASIASGAKTTAASIKSQAEADIIIAQAQTVKSDLAAQALQAKDEAEKKRLKTKAGKWLIKAQLAAFLTPGYTRPCRIGASQDECRSFEKKPMSYSKLNEFGALTTTIEGLKAFVTIGASFGNDRPRMDIRFNDPRWINEPFLFEMAKSTQALMIELGSTYVEMKLLEP